MPKLSRVLETALYVANLDKAAAFYADVMGLSCIHADHRMRAYDVGGNGVLLLFPQGGSLQSIETPGGSIPPHDGSGPMHVAFSIVADELEAWQDHLKAMGVVLQARTEWPRGGVSIYFRDPDDHLLEIATPGLWQGY
jgi:catechol 2,3-dioxygenase-like lactoylglutathione lyase family enzyme